MTKLAIRENPLEDLFDFGRGFEQLFNRFLTGWPSIMAFSFSPVHSVHLGNAAPCLQRKSCVRGSTAFLSTGFFREPRLKKAAYDTDTDFRGIDLLRWRKFAQWRSCAFKFFGADCLDADASVLLVGCCLLAPRT